MKIKLAAAALNQTPLDWEHNKNNIISAIREAKKQEIDILCCPELCITGYGCEDMFLSAVTSQFAMEILKAILPETQFITVALGLPLMFEGNLYNAACLISNGKIVGFSCKQYLAQDGIHYEYRWFKPWQKDRIDHITLDGLSYPCGDVIFDLNGIRIGFEICEDAWVEDRTAISLTKRNVDIILNPSASHFSFGKSKLRKKIIIEAAQYFQLAYIYANLLGNEAGRIIYDGDTYIAAGETVFVEGKRFSFQDKVISCAVIDMDALRTERKKRNKEMDVTKRLSLRSSPALIKSESTLSGLKNLSSEEDNIEFSYAVALGLYDYLRKSRSYGFVLNLSGGADSATVACLVYLMINLGCDELGKTTFYDKLSYIPQRYQDNLLYCFYQGTQNSSNTTKNAAKIISETLGFAFAEFKVDTIVKAYCDLIEPFIDTNLDWQSQDIALQNIQARVRAPSAWLLANSRCAILLCTSNRSESSVGYTAMDGDTSGGLCPIAGVSKSFIMQWLSWLKKEGIKEPAIKIPALKFITEQVPTAELRPNSMQQTDEADLMPYELLDAIENGLIRDKLSPLEVFNRLMLLYSDRWTKQQLAYNIDKFCKLWCQSQWKRERLAPSFHLDEESIDPKTWCRFPILSGSFEHELRQMWSYIQSE